MPKMNIELAQACLSIDRRVIAWYQGTTGAPFGSRAARAAK